jgi:hypothetical protein
MPAKRTPEQISAELRAERDELVDAVGELRTEIDHTREKVNAAKRKAPFVLAGATAAAFVVSSGLGATFRLFAGRRKPKDTEVWRLGRWSVHEDKED